MTVGHYLDRCEPIRRQLLGVSANGGFGYSSPTAEIVRISGTDFGVLPIIQANAWPR